MEKFGKFLKIAEGGIYHMYCPGCDREHRIHVGSRNSVNAQWAFNNDAEKPTFTPSVHLQIEHPIGTRRTQCHFYVKNGSLEFLSDCKHKFAGTTVPMVELDKVRSA